MIDLSDEEWYGPKGDAARSKYEPFIVDDIVYRHPYSFGEVQSVEVPRMMIGISDPHPADNELCCRPREGAGNALTRELLMSEQFYANLPTDEEWRLVC